MEKTDDIEALTDLDTEFWGLVVEGADNIAYRLAFNSLLRSLRANQKPALALIAGGACSTPKVGARLPRRSRSVTRRRLS